MEYEVRIVPTNPFKNQKPGTGGLRKPTKLYMCADFTENYIQSIISTLTGRIELGGCTIVVGGDGRYHNDFVISNQVLPMLAANGVEHVILGQKGLLSTPAASHLIRLYGADGGIILTASHNPGGINADMGIKFNVSNGGPAPQKLSNEIYEYSRIIKEYITLEPNFPTEIDKFQETNTFTIKNKEKPFKVTVVNSVKIYMKYMKKIFDFGSIERMITGADGLKPFNILIDSMSGVTGPYAINIFSDKLKVPRENLINVEPLEDFGGSHPDPNLTFGHHLVQKMQQNKNFDMGCAFDGDGDRNMVLGKNGFFVNPSDALAIIANNLNDIPYFCRKGVLGVARSMPTSCAVDRVARKQGYKIFEVPTGWKHFGNLMDTNQISLCGEESFGISSNHIREKDGIWAVLAWLSIIAKARERTKKEPTLKGILLEHWKTFGRHYFTRYDYEGLEYKVVEKIMDEVNSFISNESNCNMKFQEEDHKFTVLKCDNYLYSDPVDNNISSEQGFRIIFDDKSKIIFRRSENDSSSLIVRIYIEAFENDPSKVNIETKTRLKPLVTIANKISKIKEISGRPIPTVIT